MVVFTEAGATGLDILKEVSVCFHWRLSAKGSLAAAKSKQRQWPLQI